MSYITIREIIKDKLEALETNDNPTFVAVFLTLPADEAGAPYAVVDVVGGEASTVDTHRNLRSYEFLVSIFYRRVQGTPLADDQTALLETVDQVLNSFDTDKLLKDENDDAQVMEVQTVPVEFDLDGNNGDQISAKIRIVAKRYVENR